VRLERLDAPAANSKKVTATFCLKGPSGASHKRWLSPFSRKDVIVEVGTIVIPPGPVKVAWGKGCQLSAIKRLEA